MGIYLKGLELYPALVRREGEFYQADFIDIPGCRGYGASAMEAEINAGERPLALYYFGQDAAEQQYVLDNTLSGGVSINDVTMHPALHDAPFGGVGASGIGHYHGREGFLNCVHDGDGLIDAGDLQHFAHPGCGDH